MNESLPQVDSYLHIVIPFYDAEATLERTIRSLSCISASARSRVRVIGVDDGSVDRSSEIFERTAAEIDGIGYQLLRKDNGGSASARNLALRTFSRGWTFFLDADDELIADPFPVLDAHPDKSLICFDTEFRKSEHVVTRSKAVLVREKDVPVVLTAGNPFPVLSVIFERGAVENLMDEDLLYLEDWHFWAVNPGLFAASVSCPSLVIGRVHTGSANKSADQYQNGRFRILASERIGEYWQGRLGTRGRNNLRIQKAIGTIQMGGSSSVRAFLTLPVSPSLYGKLVVYSLFYKAYRRFYRYARSEQPAEMAR